MSFLIISNYTLVKFLDNKNLSNSILHSLACALAIDVRIMGIIIPIITLIFIILDIFILKFENLQKKQIIKNLLIYIFLLILFVILFFPTLWSNPIYHLKQAFVVMSNYPYNSAYFYLGDFVLANNVPWHYTIIWIMITTPILYFLLFIFGVVFSIKYFLKNHLECYKDNKFVIIAVLIFFLPIFITIILRSTLYNAWRQSFFIYPSFLIISIFGFKEILNKISQNKVLNKIQKEKIYFNILKKNTFIAAIPYIMIFLFLTSYLNTIYFMVRYHPHQFAYFNILAGKNMADVQNNFEIDYWGLSFRKGLEYILLKEKSKKVNIYVSSMVGVLNSDIINIKDKERLNFVDNIENAEYYILNNYKEMENKKIENSKILLNEVYSVKIREAKILVVYRIIRI